MSEVSGGLYQCRGVLPTTLAKCVKMWEIVSAVLRWIVLMPWYLTYNLGKLCGMVAKLVRGALVDCLDALMSNPQLGKMCPKVAKCVQKWQNGSEVLRWILPLT